MRIVTTGCIVGALLLVVGCSMTLEGPSSGLPPRAPPYCDRSAGGPLVVDMIGATASVLAAQAMGCGFHQAGEILSEQTPCRFYPQAFLAAVPWVVAAARGVARVNSCQKAWARFEERYPPVSTAQETATRQLALRECEAQLAPWRSEQDLVLKTELWNRLSPRCQAAVSR